MDGINGYIDICNFSKKYSETKRHEADVQQRYNKMKENLKQMYEVLNKRSVTRLLPAIVVKESKESISNVLLAVDDLASIIADTSLSEEKKSKKLNVAKDALAKAEKNLATQMDKSFYSFVSSMRLEKTINNLSDDKLKDIIDHLDEVTRNGNLTVEEKNAIVEEINEIKAEKTSKLEQRGEITDNSVLEEFDMDVDASKVDVSKGKEYSSSVIYASISRRLQQLSVEIADLQKSRRRVSLEGSIELQSKLLEQAELTKELIEFKKHLKVTLKDRQLQRANNRITKVNKKIDKLKAKNAEKYKETIEKYTNKLIELQRKQGSISYQIKRSSIIKVSKKASKIRDDSFKVSKNELIALKNMGDGRKMIKIAAIPARIRVARQAKLEEEVQRFFRA